MPLHIQSLQGPTLSILSGNSKLQLASSINLINYDARLGIVLLAALAGKMSASQLICYF